MAEPPVWPPLLFSKAGAVRSGPKSDKKEKRGVNKNTLTLKVFLAIIVNDLAESAAQFFMKTGLTQTGIEMVNLHNLPEFVSRNGSSPTVWLGILIYTLNFFLWILILSRTDLSVASLVGSTGYIVIPLVAMIFLHEKVNLLRWIGIALIAIGIHFVSKSARPTARLSYAP